MQTIKPCYFFAAEAMLFSCQEQKGAGYETFHTAKGWGYNVRVDGRILIHQESIPGLADTDGFQTKPQAEAMAKLVLQKLKSGGMPSVTNAEVKAIDDSLAKPAP